jgi:hypothetical protein
VIAVWAAYSPSSVRDVCHLQHFTKRPTFASGREFISNIWSCMTVREPFTASTTIFNRWTVSFSFCGGRVVSVLYPDFRQATGVATAPASWTELPQTHGPKLQTAHTMILIPAYKKIFQFPVSNDITNDQVWPEVDDSLRMHSSMKMP